MLSSDFLNLFGSKTKFLGGQTPALRTPMATDSLVLLFTQHKNAWLAAITGKSLPCCIACHDVCVQQQCCHRLLYKITRFTKEFTTSETNSLD